MQYKNLIILSLLFIPGLSASSKTKPINLTFAKQCLNEYYTDGGYDKEVESATHKAWNHFKKRKPSEKDIIIFDIDDTAISTFKSAKEHDFAFIPKLKDEWLAKAEAPAIKPVLELYEKLKNLGFKIIFLSGRQEQHKESTIKNLKEQGFDNFEKIILRSANEKNLSAVEYKIGKHKDLMRNGYTIIGCIGDQWSDLNGKDCGYTVKIPNYMYIID
ncbi:MAG: HAD family acid phosphatase [Candidatus Babeliales bacterium]